MDDLITFLRAQLDKDEQAARAATDWEDGRMDSHEYGWSLTSRLDGRPKRHHVIPGAPSPGRVLAEVDVKRRIIARWEGLCEDVHNAHAGGDPDAAPEVTEIAYEEVVRLLALPYADRPDYREEWRP